MSLSAPYTPLIGTAQATFKTATGTLTNPNVATFYLLALDRTIIAEKTWPTTPDITNPSVGILEANFTLDTDATTWQFEVKGSGNGVTATKVIPYRTRRSPV